MTTIKVELWVGRTTTQTTTHNFTYIHFGFGFTHSVNPGEDERQSQTVPMNGLLPQPQTEWMNGEILFWKRRWAENRIFLVKDETGGSGKEEKGDEGEIISDYIVWSHVVINHVCFHWEVNTKVCISCYSILLDRTLYFVIAMVMISYPSL